MSLAALKSDLIAAFTAALAVTPTAGQTASIDTLSDDLANAIIDNVITPMTITLDYPAASALSYTLPYFPVPALLQLGTATLTNVASVAYYKNSVLVSGSTTVAEGDSLEAVITRTGAGDASIVITLELTGGNTTRTTPEYTTVSGWASNNNITLAPSLYRTRGDTFFGNITGSTNYDRWAVSVDEWTGPKVVIFRPKSPNTGFGINTETGSISAPTNQYTRFEFGFLVAYDRFTVRELSISVAGTTTIADAVTLWYKIDYGGASSIRYYYSEDAGATWTLIHTSARTYNAATVCRIDIGLGLDGGESPEIRLGI